MNEETIAQAKAILVKPTREWSKDENAFIYKLIKAGHRDSLKGLRNEAHLDG